jgi:UPF0716 protein FxsA
MNLAIFLLILLGLPLVELYVLIQVGSEVGALTTVMLVVLTAVVGIALVRLQGFSTLMKVRAAMDRNEVPAMELLEGATLLVAGFLLLFPGFISDTLGFLCLIPPLRRRILLIVLERAKVIHPVQPPPKGAEGSNQSRIIEGEYKREDD